MLYLVIIQLKNLKDWYQRLINIQALKGHGLMDGIFL